MDEDIQVKLSELSVLQAAFLGSSMRFSEAYRSSLRMTDLFTFGALKRTLFLFDGFGRMVQARNLVCAAPLLRLQLDTALRFLALFLVDNPEDFSMKLVTGAQVRDQCAKDGSHLTDRFLCDAAASEFPWVTSAYEATSGYIHLSEKHLLSAQSPLGHRNNTIVAVNVTSYDDEVPQELYLELVDAFTKAADLLRCYVDRWTDVNKAARPRVAERA